MAVIFDTRLAAAEILKAEGIDVIDIFSEEAKKRYPVKVCVLNLLPEKPQAETEWLRGLSFSEYDVQVTFFMVESYKPKHTTQEYLDTYYSTPSKMKDEYYDGLIITGADAEKHKFENTFYWKELEEIFAWADTHVKSCYFSCWGSMAAMYHYHGIEKELFPQGGKLSGIYAHEKPNPDHILLTGQPDPIYIPHSRISRTLQAPMYEDKSLTILADSEKTGPTLLCDDEKKHVYIVGHWEYEENILNNQYVRDTGKGFNIAKPENYFDADGNIRTDQDWITQFHTMLANWIRYYIKKEKTMKLWEQYEDWTKNCKWVELSRPVSPETTHWVGFPTMSSEKIFDVVEHGFTVYEYKIVGQYGTHVDAPNHFVKDAAPLDIFKAADLVKPLCVINAADKVAENPDYALSIEDVLAWEEKHGRIPEGAFVAFRSDWHKKANTEEMQNADENGQAHYPGWAVETIKFLVEERNAGAIGHETSDTDPAVVGGAQGYPGEYYILSQNRYQIELMVNLDQVPEAGAVIFCTFPNMTGATGFTARCFALCEK